MAAVVASVAVEVVAVVASVVAVNGVDPHLGEHLILLQPHNPISALLPTDSLPGLIPFFDLVSACSLPLPFLDPLLTHPSPQYIKPSFNRYDGLCWDVHVSELWC